MSDLIKREDAIKAINARSDWYQVTCNGKQIAVMLMAKDVNEILEKLPSADRPQGKWIRTAGEYIGDDVSGFYDYHWACSECEKEAIINEWNIYELSDYCPHCGAKMKGADDE